MCQSSSVIKQFLAVVCCNLLTLSFGVSSGWATINSIELESANSTFSTGALTPDENAIVVSILSVGGFVGNFAILPLSQTIGIKRTLHFLGIPLILSSMLIIWAQNVYYLYAARILTGFVGGGLSVGVPALVNDISHDHVRAALNSVYDPCFNSGLIVTFFLGSYLSCLDQAKVQLIPSIIFLIILFFLPESPEFWSSRNKEKRAIKSCRFYKGSLAALNFYPVPQSENPEKSEKSQIIETEMPRTFENEDESKLPLSFRDFVTPHAKKALFISFTAIILCILSGPLVILQYVTYIFAETGSSMSEKNSSLFVSITQITANLMFLNIVERFNRRTLYIWSSFITAAAFFLFGAYCLLWINQPQFEWMPPFCFACIIYFSCAGLLPIPFIVTIEIFPKKIRQMCICSAVAFMWIILFVLGLALPRLLKYFGLFTSLVTFGFICLLNALFAIFFVPETRAKSYKEIVELMSNLKH